jgi:hypothetical protein
VKHISVIACVSVAEESPVPYVITSQNSQSDIPTSSRLKTKSAGQPCTASFMQLIVSLRKIRGTCKRGSSCREKFDGNGIVPWGIPGLVAGHAMSCPQTVLVEGFPEEFK